MTTRIFKFALKVPINFLMFVDIMITIGKYNSQDKGTKTMGGPVPY